MLGTRGGMNLNGPGNQKMWAVGPHRKLSFSAGPEPTAAPLPSCGFVFIEANTDPPKPLPALAVVPNLRSICREKAEVKRLNRSKAKSDTPVWGSPSHLRDKLIQATQALARKHGSEARHTKGNGNLPEKLAHPKSANN